MVARYLAAGAEDGGLLLRELLLREDARRLHLGKLLHPCDRISIHGGLRERAQHEEGRVSATRDVAVRCAPPVVTA